MLVITHTKDGITKTSTKDKVAVEDSKNTKSKEEYTWNFSMNGESHTIFIVRNGKRFDLLMASLEKKQVRAKIKDLKNTVKKYLGATKTIEDEEDKKSYSDHL